MKNTNKVALLEKPKNLDLKNIIEGAFAESERAANTKFLFKQSIKVPAI